MADKHFDFDAFRQSSLQDFEIPKMDYEDLEIIPQPTAEQTDQMITRLVELIELQREDLARTQQLVQVAQEQARLAEVSAAENHKDAKVNKRFAWAAIILTASVGLAELAQSAGWLDFFEKRETSSVVIEPTDDTEKAYPQDENKV